MADLCEVTGYKRDQLQAALKELPPYATQVTQPRVAREFFPQDMTTLGVIYVLENRYSIRRGVIATVSELLRKTLSGPKIVDRGARMLISFDPPSVTYVTEDLPLKDGVLISLGPIFEQADQYLNFDNQRTIAVQAELMFGPTDVTLLSNKRSR